MSAVAPPRPSRRPPRTERGRAAAAAAAAAEAAGATGSRVEVQADAIGRAGDRRRREAIARRAHTGLAHLD